MVQSEIGQPVSVLNLTTVRTESIIKNCFMWILYICYNRLGDAMGNTVPDRGLVFFLTCATGASGTPCGSVLSPWDTIPITALPVSWQGKEM